MHCMAKARYISYEISRRGAPARLPELVKIFGERMEDTQSQRVTFYAARSSLNT